MSLIYMQAPESFQSRILPTFKFMQLLKYFTCAFKLVGVV